MKRFGIMVVGAMLINTSYAEYWCGVLQDTYINGGLHYFAPVDIMPPPYDDAYTDFLIYCDDDFDDSETGFAEICMKYDSADEDSDTIYLRNCVAVEKYCMTDSKIVNTSGNRGCEKCPTGWAADYYNDSMHENTECSFCAKDYYSDTYETCLPCPDGGVTDEPGSRIESCYLQSGMKAQDATGNFEIMGGECMWVIE